MAQRFAGLVVAFSLALAGVMLSQAWLARAAGAVGVAAPNSYASGDFFFPPYPSGADRMGVAGDISRYTTTLQVGWYQDWGASPSPAHPGHLEYARTIYFTVHTNACGLDKLPASHRSQVTPSLTGTALLQNLRANPGALWLIGNEPDSIYNCSPIVPELYAELYHEFYTFIRMHDPSAHVAIGAIVQPSPLRLEYLDKVLNHYLARYHQPLPTALWNIHLYAFPEVAGQAGAGVPPGASATTGWTYSWAQTVDLEVLEQNLRAMRQWMADRGERDKPLIITEFGQVVPDDGSYWLDGLHFTLDVSRDYLQGSVQHFLSATDPDIGYPADGQRLVQMWAWYSLHDPVYGGDLLNLDGQLTPAGQALAQGASENFTAYVDIYPVPVITPAIPVGSSGPISVTLAVRVDNHGNAAVAVPVPARFEQFDYSTNQPISTATLSLSPVLTRYGGIQPQASTTWWIEPGSMFTLSLEVDPNQSLAQPRRSSQHLTYRVGYVPDPAVRWSSSGGAFLWSAPVTRTFTALVYNDGYLTATASTLAVTLTDSLGGVAQAVTATLPALAPGAAIQKGIEMLIPLPGWYQVTAQLATAPGLQLSAENDTARFAFLAATYQFYLPGVWLSGPLSGSKRG